jgi:hypothetical protein
MRPAATSAIPHNATSVVLAAVARFERGGDAALPQRVKILGWGENIGRTTKARIVVGEAHRQAELRRLFPDTY